MASRTQTAGDDRTDAVVATFRNMYTAMRAESRSCVELWLQSAERELGGTLILQAPTGKRDLPEAALGLGQVAASFASERFPRIAAPFMPGAAAS